MLAGLAVTWFISPSSIALVGATNGAQSGSQAVSTVTGTLSPLALCFLAGYSIDLLFNVMEKLIGAFDSSRSTGAQSR
jgi:hypothetical protein